MVLAVVLAVEEVVLAVAEQQASEYFVTTGMRLQ
jgi:hypothetical protein